jgi:hypothetical protein
MGGSKWSRSAPICFAEWTERDGLVTDYTPTPSEKDLFSRHDVKLHNVRK